MRGRVQDVLDGRAQWAVVQDDCRTVLEALPDRSVTHVITDPPYRRALYLGFRSNKRDRASKFRMTGVKLITPSYLALADGKIGALEDVLPFAGPQFLRITDRWILAFHDDASTHLWREQFGDSHIRTGVWVKSNPTPQISGDRPAQGCEFVAIAHRPGKKRWNGGGHPAVWRHAVIMGNYLERRGNPHPCPKPLSLMFELVEQFTDPGDLVLDPFCGSGTTGEACLRLGRRFIGVERDRKFAEYANVRLLGVQTSAPHKRNRVASTRSLRVRSGAA